MKRRSIFSLSWTSLCSSIHSIWKFIENVFMSAENGVANIPKKLMIFFLNLETYSQILYQHGRQGCTFFAVHRTVLRQHIKMYKIFCHNLSLPLLIFQPTYKCACLPRHTIFVIKQTCKYSYLIFKLELVLFHKIIES